MLNFNPLGTQMLDPVSWDLCTGDLYRTLKNQNLSQSHSVSNPELPIELLDKEQFFPGFMVTTWDFTEFPEMLSHVQSLLSFPTTMTVLPGTLHCNSEKRTLRDTSLKQLIQTMRTAELLGKGFQYWQRRALPRRSSSKQIGSQADRQMENADVRVQWKKRRGNVQLTINHGYSGALQKDSSYIPAPWLSHGRGKLLWDSSSDEAAVSAV